MAKGIGPGHQPVVPSFWALPAQVREEAEADACKAHGIAHFMDLPPEVRRQVRQDAVERYDRWWSGK